MIEHGSTRRRGTACSRGFSLIELLVAVLVMGIGVLGVTALQMVSLQNNREALVRGEAVHLAYDMMDRIRANPQGTPSGSAYDGLAVGDPPPNPPSSYCRTSACTGAQMVALDQAMWKCTLGSFNDDAVCTDMLAAGLLPVNPDPIIEDQQVGLPGGDGSIAVDGAGVIQISVQWRDMAGVVQSVVIDSQG